MTYINSTNAKLENSFSGSSGIVELGSYFDYPSSGSIGIAKDRTCLDSWGKLLRSLQNNQNYNRFNILFNTSVENVPVIHISYPQQGSELSAPHIVDALRRYKELNNGTDFDITITHNFLKIFKNVCDKMLLDPYVMFNKHATKVQVAINNRDFVLDYDHEEPETIYIMSPENGTFVVKESTLDKLEETLRSF